jgi:poly(A) polymerase
LSDIVVNWVRQCSDEDNRDSGGAIFPFGSFKLGVNGPNSDIDILCVAPKHIKREEHFFGVLIPTLEKRSDVTELTAVKEAFVPVAKFKFDNVEIDLLFA